MTDAKERWTTEQGWRPEVGEYVLVTDDAGALGRGSVVPVRVLRHDHLYCGDTSINYVRIARVVPGGTRVPDGAECVLVQPGHYDHMLKVEANLISSHTRSEWAYAVLSVPTVDPKRVERERLEAELAAAIHVHDTASQQAAHAIHVRAIASDSLIEAQAALKELGT